jgi:hypothetical protein
MKRYAQLGILALVLFLAVPATAWACPACLVTTEENRVAFAQTAIALTLLPLGMVGGVGMWLRSRARGNEAEAMEGEDIEGERGQD